LASSGLEKKAGAGSEEPVRRLGGKVIVRSTFTALDRPKGKTNYLGAAVEATTAGIGAIAEATVAFFGPSSQLNLLVLSSTR
jgi:hypothetical protein